MNFEQNFISNKIVCLHNAIKVLHDLGLGAFPS